MVRNLLLILFTFSLTVVSGQIEFSPDKITIMGSPDEEVITFTLDLENTGTMDMQLFWRLSKPGDFPTGWVTQFCDFNLCYDDNIDEINIELPNTIKAGEKKDFKIYLIPKGLQGSSSLSLSVFSDRYFSSKLLEINSDMVMVTSTTSIRSTERTELKIYPNPSHDFFQIANDDLVKTIVIYNIVGKEISSFQHAKGRRHNITYLDKGFFIVRLFDNKGEVLKSLRLQKN